ncbi:MAG TPA: methyltransferase domain-containing protein [Elusimicrobiota bacterium]|nr:methyltransferase domain-containing protein [Elusimicrobiota bacterium]
MSKKGYIHGYSRAEQERLSAQSKFLEPMVFSGVDFSRARLVLEIGCGVGAQTQILLRRFPKIFVQGVDVSPAQIARARENLARPITQGRAQVRVANGERLPFDDASFDGAFLCWVLEHLHKPEAVLKELRRVLKPGAVLHGIEVQNESLYLYPECPAVTAYWKEYNAAQRAVGGDPCVGARTGNLLHQAGFKRVEVAAWTRHYDQRDRAAYKRMIDYWERLLLSVAPQLLASGRVDQKLIREVRREHRRLKSHPEGVFFYTPLKFTARR